MRSSAFFWGCVLVGIATSDAEAVFEGNGYSNVIVAVSPDMPETNAEAIVNGIKSWIGGGSKKLYHATEKYAYIAEVKILIPESWSSVAAESTSQIAYEDGVIRVDHMNPVYGDYPYTVQTGLCQQRGQRIVVPPNYLFNLEQSAQMYGPTENSFVHEWSKLRYGVFTEHGYPGDPLYPLFYYKSDYTSEGYVTELKPNFDTNVELDGHREDFVNGGSCSFDPETNLPDGNCIFVPSGDNGDVISSYMAAQFLESVLGFSRSPEHVFKHDVDLPNKQNDMCGGRSTWDVISANEDFSAEDFLPGATETAPDTVFTVVRPAEGRFVLVLDVSGSMDEYDRINRLKQSATRWIRHDISDGTLLGITSFSSETKEEFPMTVVNAVTREELIDTVNDLDADGGTCLGAGIKRGIQTLSSGGPGGVMNFITDGKQDCRGSDDSDLDDPEVIAAILEQQVRIVTMAFGTAADDRLETLATISDGKTYFIPDGDGIEDLNDAFQGSLTFQPAVPSANVDIVILTSSFATIPPPTSGILDFIIDKTLGRNVTVKLDFDVADQSRLENVVVQFPDGSSRETPIEKDNTGYFAVIFPQLEMGAYRLWLTVNANVRSLVSVLVTSKSRDNETLPFYTNCWASTGTEEADVSESPLSIIAQVSQGNRPVINALVEALIEKEGESTALRIDLLDNGSGADLVSGDGLYSRYFAGFDDDGRYMLRCQVVGDDATEVNGGFNNALVLAYPLQPEATPPACCGSTALRSDSIGEATGRFSRQAVAGSIKVVGVPVRDVYPPTRISDLRVRARDNFAAIVLTFTAPGDDYDDGIATAYEVRYSTVKSNLTSDFEGAISVDESMISNGTLDPMESGQQVQVELFGHNFTQSIVYYFAVRAEDDSDNFGQLSNVGEIALVIPEEGKKGLNAGEIVGIVFGCLVAVLLIAMAAFAAINPKAKSKTKEAMKKVSSQLKSKGNM